MTPFDKAKFQLSESVLQITVRWFLTELWAIKIRIPLYLTRELKKQKNIGTFFKNDCVGKVSSFHESVENFLKFILKFGVTNQQSEKKIFHLF